VKATVNGARKVLMEVDSFKRKMKSKGRSKGGHEMVSARSFQSIKCVQQALLLPPYQTWL
jgi:hypothetical protein